MELQAVADHLEIEDVLMKYFRGADRTDYDLLRSCFFEDAQADYGPFFRGDREALMAYLAGPEALGGYTRTFHFAGNRIIELDGDVAHSEVYAMAQHEPGDAHAWAGAFVTVWMRYLDRLERRDGVWKIASRRIAVEWIRRDTAGMWEDVPAEARGRRDRTDPLYQR